METAKDTTGMRGKIVTAISLTSTQANERKIMQVISNVRARHGTDTIVEFYLDGRFLLRTEVGKVTQELINKIIHKLRSTPFERTLMILFLK